MPAVSTGRRNTRFIQRYRSELFPTAPLLITAVEKRIIDVGALTASDSVVAFHLDLAAVIDNILQVLPNTTSISVVIGNSPLERYWVEETRREFQPFMDRIKFTWLNERSLEDICRHLSSLSPQSAICVCSR